MSYPTNQLRDMEKLTQWTLRMLYLSIAVLIASTVSEYLQVQLINAYDAGVYETDEAWLAAAEINDQRQMILAILFLVQYLVTGVLALIWIHHSAHNAGVHATTMQYTPGSCVWWYFIPIANIWKPFSAMKEIWETSATQAGRGMDTGGALLGTWWALWLVANFAYNIAFRISLRGDDLESLLHSSQVTIFAQAADIVLHVVFIFMIRKLSLMQQEVRDNPPKAEAVMPGANW